MKKILLLIGVFLIAGITAYSQVKVTFTVDMSVWQKNGYFNPKTDTVRVAGDFNGWSTSATNLTAGTGADTAKFSVQVSNVVGTIHYKFIYINAAGVQWENNAPTASGNREAVIGTSDVVIPTVFFNDITGKLNHVKFEVDMSLPIKTGKLNPATDTVAATGDFTGWGTSPGGYLALTKGANDSVYSGFKDSLSSGSTLHFKFIFKSGGSVTWEDNAKTTSGNREYLVPEKDSTTFFDYWNGQNPNVQTGNGKVNFTCDMTVMTRIGIFNPAKDSLVISGGFNGWTTSDPSAFLAQNPINDSSYFITQTFTNEPLGLKQYKYVVKKTNPTGIDTIWKDGYERPIPRGGDNWQVNFAGDASKDTAIYYDGVQPDWFVPAGKNLMVKFNVDMTPAMDPVKQAVPFVPAEDTLYWISEEPTFARSQGWYRPSNGGMQYFKLSAVGNNIYSGTLALKDPAFNAFEYRYAWHKGADGSWVFEPDALGTFDTYRVRFVGQDVASNFPVNPWNMPKDTWQNNSVKTDQEVDPYQSYKDYTGIRTINQSPVTYSLSQNYPNPFNPSTTIKFSIEKTGLVMLKIYNILGQEVSTLVNQELKTGSYSYSFDASRLSSGVYFYSINSGSFNQTKKMILLK